MTSKTADIPIEIVRRPIGCCTTHETLLILHSAYSPWFKGRYYAQALILLTIEILGFIPIRASSARYRICLYMAESQKTDDNDLHVKLQGY